MSKESTLCVRMSSTFRAWIEEQAKKEGVTPSEYIRYLIIMKMAGRKS